MSDAYHCQIYRAAGFPDCTAGGVTDGGGAVVGDGTEAPAFFAGKPDRRDAVFAPIMG